MYRGLSIFGLATFLFFCGTLPTRAQFARALQAEAPGQYPAYSDNQYPSNSYGQPLPNDTAPAAGSDGQHGAARISVVQGDVNVRRGDTSELTAAAMNAPLMTQDRLQTSGGSRAEIELDSANLIRLAPNTDVGLASVEYRRFQVQVGAGTVLYRVLRPSDSQGEVDTPSIALRALGEGAFRITVFEDGTTQLDVRAGAAEILGPRGSQRIDAGHSVLVRGNPADPEFREISPAMRDQFDDWSETRDRDLLGSQSYQYVRPDVSGTEDLDANGTWVPSQYGQVWAPRTTATDWAPYSYGQWNWEPYYGWTWVDSASWGWAPYHYGRWLWNGGYGWCWWPGARLSVHLWSPALVGFFGWGNGTLGWAALAPYENYHPWWGRGAYGGYSAYGPGSFNGLRSVAVWSAYRNTAFRGGAIYAGYNGFGGPHQRFGFATREQLGSATFIRGQVPIAPNRNSYLFTTRQAVANSRLLSLPNRQYFQYQSSRFGGGGQRVGPVGGSRGSIAVDQYRSTTQRSNNTNIGRGTPDGWHRFGDPGSGNGYRQGFTGSGGAESGWHQFGRPQQASPPLSERSYSSGQSGNYNRSVRPYSGGSPVPQGAPQQRGYGGGYRGIGNAAPRYTAPSQPHYSAPSLHGGGSFRGGEAASHSGGGHSSSSGGSGRHGR